MKYFVIYSDNNSDHLENFKTNNQHLTTDVTPVKAPVSNLTLRDELISNNIITENNIYDLTTLAFTKTHLSLWQQAVETQSPVTVFESNTVTHKNFLEHQKKSLSLKTGYDLIIWGYNLNWNPCVEIMTCLPKIIYTFMGYGTEELEKPNNDLIDVSLYKNSDLKAVQTLKTFSFSGLGCYTISAKGAKQLLQKATSIGNETARSYQEEPHGSNFYVFNPTANRENTSFDIEINRHIEPLNTYMTIPMLAVIPTNP
ncbi:Glycosyltransferase involved in cell wall bisynthesis (WcaA) (PDB:5MLZ) [Commensalibacter communis]|uniref:glycosyltransferase family 25 protein n=1 Tax=Commensalibacter communis TaxID=2972786 RepID=UPI0022FFAFF6|nr:glycosyltransferase family 25 protein [Commensalibacter communis]CAI3954750.1 Glycosyltransferase involved in cell wall bisynthesis (WcaA) (PDB:5MLZ) [Commensalibacter communis]